jgi:hypothetical protein
MHGAPSLLRGSGVNNRDRRIPFRHSGLQVKRAIGLFRRFESRLSRLGNPG